MTNEAILLNFLHTINYKLTQNNIAGATTDQTLRNITAYNDGNCLHVRKHGILYPITDITNVTKPTDTGAGERLVFEFRGITSNTYLGSIIDQNGAVAAFADGGIIAATEGVKCIISCEAGAGVTIPNGRQMTLTTDVDGGGFVFYLGAETLDNGESIDTYLSNRGGIYYDNEYKYNQFRVPEQFLGTERQPFYDPKRAIADPNIEGFSIITVLDSEPYDMLIDIPTSGMVLQAALGQTPHITSGVGARITREVSVADGSAVPTCFNNDIAVFWNENGNNGTANADLSWQYPYKTWAAAFAARGARTNVIYGGDGATVTGGIFDAQNTIAIGAINVESEYGYTPSLIDSTNNTNGIINITNTDVDIRGFIFDNKSGYSIPFGIYINSTAWGGEIKDCSFYNFTQGISDAVINTGTGTIHYCYFENNSDGIRTAQIGAAATNVDIEYNIFNSNTEGIEYNDSAGTNTVNGDNRNNIFYNNNVGIGYAGPGTLNGIIENNTIFNSTLYGISLSAGVIGATFRNMIIWNSGTYDLNKFGGAAATITDTNYGTNSGFDVSAPSNITTNPNFCKITLPYKLGISADSGAYRTDSNNDDMGAHLRIIEINNDNIKITGFNISGQDQYNNALFIVDAVNHVDTEIRWNNIFDFSGIGIDPYDNDTNTDCIISNNKIYNNGNGIKLSYGGNTVEENCIYNNSVFGIWLDRTGQTFNHNVFYGNQYGIYIESNAGGISIKNCIFHLNSLYGIYSEINISINYCCITDVVNNVDISDVSNFTNNPQFVNLTSGSEDFNIKTKMGAPTVDTIYEYDSACKNAADDGKDIGAYDVTRATEDDYWKKFQLPDGQNPRVIDYSDDPKGFRNFESSTGAGRSWGKDRKRRFLLTWTENQVSSQILREKIEYITGLVLMRKKIETQEQVKIRLNPLLTETIESGTNGVINAANKTLTDSTKTWNEDAKRGYHSGVKFKTGTNLVISASGKTATKAGEFTSEDWTGYILPINGYFFFILSNTNDALSLSDPKGYLTDDTISYSIEKYFKVDYNDETILTLLDPNSELIDGTYDYYIKFIEVRIVDPKFRYSQARFFWQQETWKNGFKMLVEEL